MVYLALYGTAELQGFHSKFENQVILGRTCLCFNPCDVVLIGIFFK